jgi:7-keto-8-aminopelargonate synthetase-like enzyme
LINRARSFIYSTAPPAPVAAAAAKAVEVLGSEEGLVLIRKLWRNIRHLELLLGLPRPASAIVPIVIGPEAAAMAAGESLRSAGFLVPAIRFPTVSRGAARLRITLSASHSEQDVAGLAEGIRPIIEQSSHH